MPGIFSSINMASNALRMFSRAMETSGHNIANVNTPGYSRQTVEFKTNPALTIYSAGWKALGTGVGMSGIERIRNEYLERSSHGSSGSLGKFQTIATMLKRVEGVYGEPGDNGVAAALDQFFDSWSALGSNPTEPAARLQVRHAGSVLTERIRGAHNQIVGLEARVNAEAKATIEHINQLAESISALNDSIREFSITSGAPNDLLDQRDTAIRELSGLVNVTVSDWPDGTRAVYIGGFNLVDNVGAHALPSDYDYIASTVTDGTNDYPIRSGTLAGLFQTLGMIDDQKAEIGALADELRTQFNTIHATGINADGDTGINFFKPTGIAGAADFSLSDEVIASLNAIAAGTTGNAGDGGLALTLAGLRDTALIALGDQTFHAYYSGNIGRLGTNVSFYESAESTEAAVAAQIANQMASVSGVSLDDEMADMIRFQRSYQAAARALMVFDQVAEDLIGMIR